MTKNLKKLIDVARDLRQVRRRDVVERLVFSQVIQPLDGLAITPLALRTQ